MGTGSRTGREQWFGDWDIDWAVQGTEGLCLLAGNFRGRRVFQKLSVPVIRVQYAQDEDFLHNPLFGNGCGPYNDMITWDTEDFGEDLNPIRGPHHLKKRTGTCGDSYVCVRADKDANGVDWLELSVYARIGAYHIIQGWYLNNDGVVKAKVFSKGLSCNVNHTHHPYWRFEFALNNGQHQRVSVFDGQTYKGFYEREGGLIDSKFANPRYWIRDLDSGMSVWVVPQSPGSEPDIIGPSPFAKYDGYLRRYDPAEDGTWKQPPERGFGFSSHGQLDGTKVVFWSVGHLFHGARHGGEEFHGTGPTIIVVNDELGGHFDPVFPDESQKAMEDFRYRTNLAGEREFAGAFPNFYVGVYAADHVAGTIFVSSPHAEWHDVPIQALGDPDLTDFGARFRGTADYAASHGYVGGFPTFYHAGEGESVVCGTVLLSGTGAEWRDVPVSELGGVDLADIAGRFKATQDYANAHGFVGGFPNFHSIDYGDGRGVVCGTVLLKPGAAEWQDVFLFRVG